jgi:hypothetical protein
MEDELRTRFVRARLAAILEHELRESGHTHACSCVAIAPRLGYIVAVCNEEALTIRLVQE